MNTYYENATSEQQEAMEKRIHREVVACQTPLVSLLMERGIIEMDEIQNLYRNIEGEQDEEDQEPLEWYLILDSGLIEKIRANGQPVLETEFGTWWGRTCSGQSIVLDPTFWEIYQDWITGDKWHLWIDRPRKEAA